MKTIDIFVFKTEFENCKFGEKHITYVNLLCQMNHPMNNCGFVCFLLNFLFNQWY